MGWEVWWWTAGGFHQHCSDAVRFPFDTKRARPTQALSAAVIFLSQPFGSRRLKSVVLLVMPWKTGALGEGEAMGAVACGKARV